MRKSRLVAALLAALFTAVGAAPVLLAPAAPDSWAWAAVVWCIALGFLTLALAIPSRRYRAAY